MMYFGSGAGSGWPMVMMIVSSLALWAVIIGAAVVLTRLYRRPRPSGGSAAAQASPQLLLGQRFAKGEISEQEYTSRLRVLSGNVEAERTEV